MKECQSQDTTVLTRLRPERADGKTLTAPLFRRRKEGKEVPHKKTKQNEVTCGPKQKITVLSDWIIKPLPDSRGVCVEGQKEGMDDFWHSTAIVEAKKPKHVVTVSGSVYILEGKINKLCTVDNGFSKDVANAFCHGFPKNWKEIIQNFYRNLEDSISIYAECSPLKGKKVQKLMPGKKRKLASSSKITKDKEDDIQSNQSIWTPAGLIKQEITSEEVTVTRSGRMSLPPLAGWVGQRYSTVPGTNTVQVTFETDFAEQTLNKETKDILRLPKKSQKMMNDSKLSKSLLVSTNSISLLDSKDSYKKNMTFDCLDKRHAVLDTAKKNLPAISEREQKTTDVSLNSAEPQSKPRCNELHASSSVSRDIRIVLEDCSKSLDAESLMSSSGAKSKSCVYSERLKDYQSKTRNNVTSVENGSDCDSGRLKAVNKKNKTSEISDTKQRQETVATPPVSETAGLKDRQVINSDKDSTVMSGTGHNEKRSSRRLKSLQTTFDNSSLNVSVESVNAVSYSQQNGHSQRPRTRRSFQICMDISDFSKENGRLSPENSLRQRKDSDRVERSKNGLCFTDKDESLINGSVIQNSKVPGRKTTKPKSSSKRKIQYSPTPSKSPPPKLSCVRSSTASKPSAKASSHSKAYGKPPRIFKRGKTLHVKDTNNARNNALPKCKSQQQKRKSSSEKNYDTSFAEVNQSEICDKDSVRSQQSRKRKRESSFTKECATTEADLKSSPKGNKKRKTEQDHESWTAQEKIRLERALKEINGAEKFYWFRVSEMVGTKSQEECQQFYKDFLEIKMAKKRNRCTSKLQAKRKATGRQKGEPIRGGKGTLKRKQDLRDFLDEQNEGYEDNFFESTPFATRKPPSSALGVDFDRGDSESFWAKFDCITPAVNSSSLATPGAGLKARLASAKKTPSCANQVTLTSPQPVNRRDADRYMKSLADRKRKHGPVQAIPEADADKSVLPVKSIFSSVATPSIIVESHSLNDDNDEEEDNSPYMYYWNDEN